MFLADGVHRTPLGHQRLATMLVPILETMAAAETGARPHHPGAGLRLCVRQALAPMCDISTLRSPGPERLRNPTSSTEF